MEILLGMACVLASLMIMGGATVGPILTIFCVKKKIEQPPK